MRNAKKAAMVVAALVAIAVLTAALFGRRPAFEAVPEGADRLTAGAPEVVGSRLEPYTRVLGVPVSRRGMDVRVRELQDGFEVVYDFDPGDPAVEDRMILDRESLAPRTRAFPGQSFRYRGDEMEAVVERQDGTVDTIMFQYGGDVFEVSVLDLVAVARDPEEGDAYRVAWGNFADADQWLAEVRVRGEEVVSGPGGESFDTRIVDVLFPSGELRRFWLASRPPYKVRQRRFDRGRLVTSGWDLVEYRTGSG
jgi:hypothetical protein